MGAMHNRNYEKYSEPVPSVKCMPIMRSKFSLAGILKPVTYDCLMAECSIFNLTESNYMCILFEKQLDLLLADMLPKEEDEELNDRIEKSLEICRELNIPAVFWDTGENDLFFDNLDLLRQFDAVFTVQSSKIEHYKSMLMSDNVFFLPFAAQPRMVNPVEKNIMNKEDSIHENPQLILERIKGTANKIYSIQFLNTIEKEPAFVPKEIFELLALGVPLISPYAKALDELCSPIVKLYKKGEEYENLLSQLLKDKDAVDKLSVLGQRFVFSSHTYTARIDAILEKVGLIKKPFSLPGVTMITSTNKLDSMDNIFRNYENQKYKTKELVIVLNNNGLDLGLWRDKAAEYSNVKVFQVEESQPLGRCLNLAVDNSGFPYISKCDDDNYYGPDFLSDLINSFKYTDSEIVGKLTYYCYLEGCRILAMMCPQMEYRYVNMLSGSAFITKREVCEAVRFSDKPIGSDTVFFNECVKKGVRMYSADRFNYAYNRHASMNLHTWKMADEVFLRSCKVVDVTDDYIERVTV